jgi:hypothetical protein
LWFCYRKKAAESCDSTALFGAMEGTRTPGLLIRRNFHAIFVHSGFAMKSVCFQATMPFFTVLFFASFALLSVLCTEYPALKVCKMRANVCRPQKVYIPCIYKQKYEYFRSSRTRFERL